jgi:lipid-binding SYLF domain-containing protein
MQLSVTRAVVLASVVSCVAVGTARANISTAEQKRLSDAASVVTDLRAAADKGIPEDLWSKAECVVVIPGMKKAAFIFGGEYGRGVMSCRAGNGWSAPAFMQLAKGSWGFQAGAEEIDLVLLVMNRRGAEKMLDNNVSLGVDASVAAGPVGRAASASTDGKLTAEVLAYSRAHGVFAGINLSGGALKPDKDANADAYGAATVHDVVLNGKASAPAEASDFIRTLGGTTRATTGTAPGATTDKY